MKYKYRIITAISGGGNELFLVQFRPVWWPFWFELSQHSREELAVKWVEIEKKKDAYKGRVVRLG